MQMMGMKFAVLYSCAVETETNKIYPKLGGATLPNFEKQIVQGKEYGPSTRD